MLGFLSFILIVISILCFLLGYAYLNNKAEDLLSWNFSGKIKEMKDQENYKKQQGKFTIVIGTIFFLVPISINFIDTFNIYPKMLYVWIFALALAVLLNIIQVRKFN